MSPTVHIETFQGEGNQPWFFRLASSNGQPIVTSEGYSRKWNRDRAVKRLTKLFPGLEVRPAALRAVASARG